MFSPGDVISYIEMCTEEGTSLQRGMNYRLRRDASVILMSLRPNAPYGDQVAEDGRVLIYEGHDMPRSTEVPNSKAIDQPMRSTSGSLTQNGLFFQAASRFCTGEAPAEIVRVYEKVRTGIWVYNGLFRLIDAWLETNGARRVFKFKLELLHRSADRLDRQQTGLENNRLIPTAVKLEVWQRDNGRCTRCGSTDNLHFDHIIPYSSTTTTDAGGTMISKQAAAPR